MDFCLDYYKRAGCLSNQIALNFIWAVYIQFKNFIENSKAPLSARSMLFL